MFLAYNIYREREREIEVLRLYSHAYSTNHPLVALNPAS